MRVKLQNTTAETSVLKVESVDMQF